jgi:hypothetical protein
LPDAHTGACDSGPRRGAGSASTQDLDDARGIGPAAAEELREEPATSGGDRFAVDEDVELARLPDLELGIDARSLLDVRGETRRAIAVASGPAVEDGHAHLEFSSPSTNSIIGHAGARRKSSPISPGTGPGPEHALKRSGSVRIRCSMTSPPSART